MHRIFLAINLPEKVKAQLLGYKERWPELPARWTKPENLHVTLLFLGNTSEKELKDITKKAKEVATRHQVFSMLLSQIVYGPSTANPRMVWATGELPKELKALHQSLQKTLVKVPDKKPFSLHITLARLKEWEFQKLESEERPDIQENISLEIPVRSIDIMESNLKRTGAEYRILETCNLKHEA